jgi:hypothetical protein
MKDWSRYRLARIAQTDIIVRPAAANTGSKGNGSSGAILLTIQIFKNGAEQPTNPNRAVVCSECVD